MKLRRQHNHARAFTLIELVLALAIAGIVLTAINSVFFAALKLRDETVRVSQQTMPVDRAVEIIKNDVAGIMPPGVLPGVMGTDAIVNGMTHPLIVEIYTSSGVLRDDVPWGDVQKIDYWLQPPTNRNSGGVGLDLMRGVTRNLLSTTVMSPTPEKLLSGVSSFRFSFYDGTNWNDTWSVQLSNTPVMMKAFLKFAAPKNGSPISPPIQFYVPIVMQISTNIDTTNTSAVSTNTTSN